ncbi:F0F1 ATP synthase subunit epsilon [Xanthobacter sp. TB0136]|uniref:F0F1 ATP synthase subunit epsilon n=1 Tax=Xanthobacter sp. TB0136 TaxID=3459177 RepID=UPI0040392413
MATLSFELVSPEKLVFSGEATEVIIPGAEGEFGVLAGHGPFVGMLKPGILTIRAAGAAERFFVRGGFAEVNASGLTVLAEEAISTEDLDPSHIQQQIQNAREDLADAKGDEARQRAEALLSDLQQVADALANGLGGKNTH